MNLAPACFTLFPPSFAAAADLPDSQKFLSLPPLNILVSLIIVSFLIGHTAYVCPRLFFQHPSSRRDIRRFRRH
jgi:hypothetical protein